jgi:hypothetical protein
MKDLIEDIKKQMTYTYDHRVSYENYVIAQDKNTEFNDVIILKDNKEILHTTCTKQFNDKELLKMLLDFIKDK